MWGQAGSSDSQITELWQLEVGADAPGDTDTQGKGSLGWGCQGIAGTRSGEGKGAPVPSVPGEGGVVQVGENDLPLTELQRGVKSGVMFPRVVPGDRGPKVKRACARAE